MASLWGWKARWWTSPQVSWSGDVATCTAGGILSPWASDAQPVGSGWFDITFRYAAQADAQVRIAANVYSQVGEGGQRGQVGVTTVTLPASRSVATARFRVQVTTAQPLWGPDFQAKSDVVLHGIDVEAAIVGVAVELVTDDGATVPARLSVFDGTQEQPLTPSVT